MKLLDLFYDFLKRQRDKKERDVIRLRWEKSKLKEQLHDLKAKNAK